MRRLFSLGLIGVFCLALTACGPREHSIFAASAVGAGLGIAGAAIANEHPLTGMVIGAGMGALAGAAFEPHHHHHRHYAPPPPPRRHYGNPPGWGGRPPHYGRHWR